MRPRVQSFLSTADRASASGQAALRDRRGCVRQSHRQRLLQQGNDLVRVAPENARWTCRGQISGRCRVRALSSRCGRLAGRFVWRAEATPNSRTRSDGTAGRHRETALGRVIEKVSPGRNELWGPEASPKTICELTDNLETLSGGLSCCPPESTIKYA